MCVRNFSGETQHTHLLIPVKEPTTNKSTNTVEIQFVKSMIFIGVSYRNMMRVTYRSRNYSEKVPSPKPIPYR